MKPEDVLQEQQGRAALARELDEMRAFDRASLNRMPLLARIATGMPPDVREAADSVEPYSALNSWNSEPSTIRAMTSCTS